MWVRAVAIGAVLCAALGACDGDEGANSKRFDGDSAEVAAVVDRLQGYAREGDGARICSELITPQLARFIESSYDRSCAQRVAAQLAGDGTTITVRRLEVQGPLASATVVEANRQVTGLAFVKRDGTWRISRIRG